MIVGRCGPVGLFVMYKSATAPRVEGSKQAVSSSFSSSRTYRQQTGVKKLRLQAVARRKAGAAAKAGSGDDDSFRKWNGYEKRSFRFVSKTIKWLTPSIKRIDMEVKIITCC